MSSKADHSDNSARRSSVVERLVSLLAVFLFGGVLAIMDIAPFPSLERGLRATATLFQELTQTRPAILEPLAYEGEGVVTFIPDAAQPGYTLVQGLLPGGAQIRMIDMEGNEVHRWNIDYFDLWPSADHVVPKDNLPKSEFKAFCLNHEAYPASLK